MKNVKKLISGVILGALSISLLAGCGGTKTEKTSGNTEEVKEITAYGVIDPQISAQQIIADKKGYFEEEGLKVTNKLLQQGGDISPLVSGGTAEVSFESTYTDISLAANGVDVKILSTMSNSGNTQCVVAGKNSGITNAKDLEGKKVGIGSGAAVLIAIRNMCKELDVDIDKIKFVTLAPSDQISSLEKGDIDAMACWEPWVSNAVEAGGTLLFSGLQSYFPEKSGSVNWLNFHTTFQVTGDFLKKNPKTCEAMLRALKKATDFINENQDEAAEIIAKEINLTTEEVKNIMSKNEYTMNFDQNFVDASNEIADFMLEMENIKKKPEFSSYADSTSLKNAVPELVTIE